MSFKIWKNHSRGGGEGVQAGGVSRSFPVLTGFWLWVSPVPRTAQGQSCLCSGSDGGPPPFSTLEGQTWGSGSRPRRPSLLSSPSSASLSSSPLKPRATLAPVLADCTWYKWLTWAGLYSPTGNLKLNCWAEGACRLGNQFQPREAEGSGC